MKVFIHIGLQKTGTTALQELVFKKMNVNYIRYFDRELYKSNMYNNMPLLISNEDLSGLPSNLYYGMERYQIARNLHTLFPEAHIILGLREPLEWIQSFYYEMVRQGSTMSYQQFTRTFPAYMLDFDSYIECLQGLFPSVYVFNFETLKTDFNKTVQGICEYIGVDTPEYDNMVINQSIKDWQVPGFRLINRIAPKKLFRYLYNMVREDVFQ